MSQVKLLFFSLCVVLLTGCAAEVSNIDPSTKQNLNAEEGFLLIAINTNTDLEEVRIIGEKFIKFTAKDLYEGDNFVLTKLPAGSYTFDAIKSSSYVQHRDFDDDLWTFSIKPGVISYVGHLNFKRHGYWRWWARIELENNASLALEHVETNYQQLLSDYKIEYQGPGEDDFFNLVGVQKQGASK